MDPSSSSSSSLVSRAKTAIHTAAAKAEKVFAEIKIDLVPDRERAVLAQRRSLGELHDGDNELQDSEKIAEQNTRSLTWKSFTLGMKQDWRSSLKNLGIGKKERDGDIEQILPDNLSPTHGLQHSDPRDSKTEVNVSSACDRTQNLLISPSIPSSSIIKSLGTGIMKAKDFKSVSDLLALDEDSSQFREKLGLSLHALKSIVSREKDELNHEISGISEISNAVQILFNSVEQPLKGNEVVILSSSLLASIHGAPPGSFVAKASEIAGSFRSLRKMGLFWQRVVFELRRQWSIGKPVPHMPPDEPPDLNCCLLHQQLQVINCCIARKVRRIGMPEVLDLNVGISQDKNEFDQTTRNDMIFVKNKSGVHVLRIGAHAPSKNLTMIETGEQIYSPYVQEGPVFTEELIKENEEFIMRTGSIGPGCSQLLSDMQAFKAANPGCILEDFIRWYSPPDWEENIDDDLSDSEDVSSRGRLSGRMRREGNLWRELWLTAQPLPAAKQAPLFDEDLAVESILTSMESISPSELLAQLFLGMLSSGFSIAESVLGKSASPPKLFHDCKKYVTVTCQSGLPVDRIDDLCKVYGTVEKMLTETEAKKVLEERTSDEPRSGMKKFHLQLIRKDKLIQPDSEAKEQRSNQNNGHMFSNLFDSKASLFRKKESSDKHAGSSPAS